MLRLHPMPVQMPGLVEEDDGDPIEQLQFAAVFGLDLPDASGDPLNFPVISREKSHDFIGFFKIRGLNHDRFDTFECHTGVCRRLFELEFKGHAGVEFPILVPTGRD